MPLFFLIAIGAGALTVGATTVDVIGDNQETRAQARAAQTQQQPQQQGFASLTDCQQWAAQHGRSAANCQQR